MSPRESAPEKMKAGTAPESLPAEEPLRDDEGVPEILRDVWRRAAVLLRSRLGERTFDLWFSGIRPRSLVKGVLTLDVRNGFIRTWLEDHYRNDLRQVLAEVLGAGVDIEVRALSLPPPVTGGPDASPAGSRDSLAPEEPPPSDPSDAPAGEEDEPRLDEFIAEPGTELAVRAVRRVVESPGDPLVSPLFLCGPPGVGKTHLLRGAVRALRESRPELKILFLPARQFLEQYVYASRKHHLDGFRERLRELSVLAIDDIEGITGRSGTQTEFHAQVRHLLARRAQLLVSASVHPRDMAGLEPTLRGAFLSGLVVELPPPDADSLLRILAARARRHGKEVPEEVLREAIAVAGGDARRASLAVKKIIAYAALVGRPVTLDLFTGPDVSQELHRDPSERGKDVVERLVLERFPVRRDLLYSKRKLKYLQLPRRICMYLLRSSAGMSVPEIASLFGGRSGISVTSSLRRVETDLARSPELRDIVDDMRRRIRFS